MGVLDHVWDEDEVDCDLLGEPEISPEDLELLKEFAIANDDSQDFGDIPDYGFGLDLDEDADFIENYVNASACLRKW